MVYVITYVAYIHTYLHICKVRDIKDNCLFVVTVDTHNVGMHFSIFTTTRVGRTVRVSSVIVIVKYVLLLW